MKVKTHARTALIALTQKMPVPAAVIIERLEKMEAPEHSVALEVCQMTMSHGSASKHADRSSNGDSVIVIIRDGVVLTAMLRRSWNQEWTPAALRVSTIATWKDDWK